LFHWREKIWFQLARKICQSVLRASVKRGPSLNLLISLYIFSVHRWMLYGLFVVQANSEPHPSDIPPLPNEACACERFLSKEGLNLLNERCPGHALVTLELTNKHSQTATCGLRKRQASRPPTVSLRNKRTEIALNLKLIQRGRQQYESHYHICLRT
jgi:hypothetical protein